MNENFRESRRSPVTCFNKSLFSLVFRSISSSHWSFFFLSTDGECKVDSHVYPDALLRGNRRQKGSIVALPFESTQYSQVHVAIMKLPVGGAHMWSPSKYDDLLSNIFSKGDRLGAWTLALDHGQAYYDS